VKVGRGVHQAHDLDDALDLVQVADGGMQRAQQVDGDGARGLLAFLGADVCPSWPTQALPSFLAMWPERNTRLPVRTKGT
jgi:hypothetical protein